MFAWYRSADARERRTFWACYSGWALDAFDAQAFGLVIPALIATLHVTRTDVGLLASIALVAGALGGWLGGAISDRVGRLTALKATVTLFTIATFACALAQNATQLAVLKAFQGLGFGAEWAAGAVLMAETIRPSLRGRALSTVQSGWALGWGGAVIGSGVAFSCLTPAAAWRVVFAIGIVPGLFVLWLRFRLDAPAAVAAVREKSSFFRSLLGIFERENLRATIVGGLLGLGAHGGFYGLFTWLPTFLKEERHLSIMKSSGYLGVIIVSFGIGCLAAGQLLDRFGRRTTVAAFAAGCILVTLVYLLAPIGGAAMLALGFPLGFFAAGIPASMSTLFNELYPAEVRGSGVGFCYNAGRILAAALPALIGAMSEHWSLAAAIGLDAGLAYALVILAVILLPDRTGISLNVIEKETD